MITMENVLKRGRTVWDRFLLPEDEYVERVRAVRRIAEERGLDLLVVLGQTPRIGDVCYLSGCIPPLGWMAVVLGQDVGPVLVISQGPRDLPFLRTQTWIEEIRPSASLFVSPAETVAGAVSDVASPGARIGLVGARDALATAAYAELRRALEAYDVVEVDGLLADLRSAKRARERVALQRSLEIARASVEAASRAWCDGASNAAAVLEAERAARRLGARDVRALGNLYGNELAPVEATGSGRLEPLVVYCAVEARGYWGQTCATTGDEGAARRAVGAMVAAAGPGVAADTLLREATRELLGGDRDIALSYGLGSGIGLDLTERPLIVAGNTERIAEGAVLALQAITVEDGVLKCAGETIHVGRSGAVAL